MIAPPRILKRSTCFDRFASLILSPCPPSLLAEIQAATSSGRSKRVRRYGSRSRPPSSRIAARPSASRS